MIHIEVINSNDPLAVGVYDFEFNQITVGRSRKCDLIFNDSKLPLQYLAIKTLQGQLVAQSKTREPFFFINGKKVSGTLKLKINDVIAFGSNEIRILDCRDSQEPTDFSSAYDVFTKKSPELKFALEFIEQVLIDMEKN